MTLYRTKGSDPWEKSKQEVQWEVRETASVGGADWRDEWQPVVFLCVWSQAESTTLTRLLNNNRLVHDKAGKATFKVCLKVFENPKTVHIVLWMCLKNLLNLNLTGQYSNLRSCVNWFVFMP